MSILRLGSKHNLLLTARCLNTSATKPSSSGGIGKLLLAVALAAPPCYVAYQTRFDEEFGRNFKSSFPLVYEKVASIVGDQNTPTLDGIDLASLKLEIQQLETRFEIAQPVTVTIPKPHLEVDEKTESVAVTDPVKSEAPPIHEEPDVDTEPEAVVSPGRESIEKVKGKARGVKRRANKETASKIQELEASLRADLEVVLSKDLGDLDEEGLRRRIVQLVLELRDRSRWEALRLHELTRKHTEDLVGKYEELLGEQGARYEELVRFEIAEARLHASEEAKTQVEDHFNRVLQNKELQWRNIGQDQLDRQRAEMSKEMEHRFNSAKANLQKQAASELSARAEVLEQLKEKVQTLQSQLRRRSEDETEAKNLNKISVATLELQFALSKHPDSLRSELKRLESVEDPVVKSALKSLSPRVHTNGVASEIELQRRFETVFESCHRVALVPEEGGFLQHAGAAIVSKLTLSTGATNTENEDSPEGVLYRARHQILEKNSIEGALMEMEKLKGPVKDTASDWLLQARDRVAVENAVSLIKSHLSSIASKLG